MESIYTKATQYLSVTPGEAALLLGVFSISAFFADLPGVSERSLTEDAPARLSKTLAKSALDVLDYSRRNTYGTLEDIQAYIIMSYVSFIHDSSSPTGRLHTGTAVTLARNLGLHRLDASTEGSYTQLSPKVRLDRELKRRAFWYLASAEWYSATLRLYGC